MDEKRYSLKDVLKELGVAKNTYRNWERVGKVPLAKRDPMNNYRYWTQGDLDKLKKITGRA